MGLIIRISEPIPSQNQTAREHWATKQRRKKRYTVQILVALMVDYGYDDRKRLMSRPKGVHLTITSKRRRRITDIANLIGGAKGLIDAIVSLGLIYDDADEYVTIEYRQETGKPYYTEITINGD